jgi:hypothetical protein
MEKDRTRRYPSASELAFDVKRHLNGDAVIARPPSASYRLRKFVTKHKLGVASSVLAIGALAVGLVITAMMYNRANDARREAERQAYAAEIAAIDLTIKGGSSVQAREAERRLSEIPPHRRGWEWRYLARTIDASLLTLWGAAESVNSQGRPMSGPGEVMTQPRYQGRLALSVDSKELAWATARGLHVWNIATQGFDRAQNGHGLEMLSVLRVLFSFLQMAAG